MFEIFVMASLVLANGSLGNAEEIKFKSWPQACSAAEASVAEGDLVFLDIPIFLFRKVAESTQSWTSHVGVVFKNSEGEWVVAESAIPRSREKPLCDYLKRSSKHNFEIKRLSRPLSDTEVSRLRATAQSLLNKNYDLGFNFDSKKMFCSKFVHVVYKSIGVDVGEVQTFEELIEANPDGPVDFWKYWFFGKIPKDRKTITPASQLNDPQFTTVLRGK